MMKRDNQPDWDVIAFFAFMSIMMICFALVYIFGQCAQ